MMLRKHLVLVVCLTVAAATEATAQLPTPLPGPSSLNEDRSATEKSTFDALQDGGFPVMNQEDASAFWAQDETRFLSSGAILLNEDALESSLELVSDVVGVFRLGIGVSVAADREEPDTSDEGTPDAQATLSQLANTGGAVHLTAALPLLYSARSAFNSTWAVISNTILATEAPSEDGFLEDPAMSAQSGIDVFYERRGVGGRIDFQTGLVARGYWFNEAYADKGGIDQSAAFLLVPRIGLTILKQTRVDIHWRAIQTSAFDELGGVAVTVQQVGR